MSPGLLPEEVKNIGRWEATKGINYFKFFLDFETIPSCKIGLW